MEHLELPIESEGVPAAKARAEETPAGGLPVPESGASFQCYICGERSTEICSRCTRDTCDNHICERCLLCSDCCICDERPR